MFPVTIRGTDTTEKDYYKGIHSINLGKIIVKIQIRAEILEMVFKRKNRPNTTSRSRLNQGKILNSGKNQLASGFQRFYGPRKNSCGTGLAKHFLYPETNPKMNNSIRTVSKIKSSFFLASAIIQSISGILLLRQAIVKKNGYLNFPAIALLYDCGKNILNLVSELKAQRNVKRLGPPVIKPISRN